MAMWIAPEDKDPSVLQYPPRKGIDISGAVIIRTGEFAGMMSEPFNTITFQIFLIVLIRRGKVNKMWITQDNATYHHAKLLWP
jgi:hypothetical protein